jgi:ferric-dicitrate binding protein FerR (iron transport regulator)
MENDKCTVEHLMSNEKFVKWAINPDLVPDTEWQKILNAAHEDEQKASIAIARDMVRALQSADLEAEIEEDAHRVWSNLQPVVRGEKHQNPSIPMFSIQNTMKIAASLVLLVLAGIWWSGQNKPTEPVVVNEIKTIEKANPKGRRSQVTLKDGTKVTLNSESKIIYTSDYGNSSRDITLIGEAFFEVAKDPHRPFVVTTGKVTTTALGTSFNISSFPEEEEVVVSLASGKVKVEELDQQSESFVLEPGEQIIYAKEQGAFERLHPEDDAAYLWKDGIISFDQATISDIVKKLERWYGVTIVVGNTPGMLVRYDGIFKQQSLENVLKAMSFSLNFSYTIHEEEIKIMFN